jgi:hypothetical protein
MTVDTFVPLPGYTVMGVGPYGIDWPYGAGAVRAAVILAGVRTDLVAGTDFTVTPAASTTTGSLYLTVGAATTYATGTLYITRETLAEQGWQGLLGAREAGLEAQLDLLTERVQELEQLLTGTLRLDTPQKPFAARVGAAVIFDAGGHPIAGPTATQIASAQSDAAAAHADRLVADASAAAAAASAASADVRRNADQTFTGINSFANTVRMGSDKLFSYGQNGEVEALYSTPGDKWILRAMSAILSTIASFRFNGFEFVDRLNAKTFIRAVNGAQVEIAHNGAKKLETTATGVTVTGVLAETARATEKWTPRASPAFSTWYQNTTGRKIAVTVSAATAVGSISTMALHVNDTPTNNVVGSSTGEAGARGVTLGAQVPPGHYYSVVATFGSFTGLVIQELI